MSEATQKRPLFGFLFRIYSAWRLRRHFSDVRLLGGESLQSGKVKSGFILACNHVAWWDPLLLIHLDAWLKTDGYCLMDRQNLGQFSFFRWLGAVPIDRSSPSRAYRDIKRASRLLPGAGRLVVIFPQGTQRAAHLPLKLKSGVAELARVSGVPVLPLAIRYDFGESPKQIVHLSVGSPLFYGESGNTRRKPFMDELKSSMEGELKRIDRFLVEANEGGISLLGRDKNADQVGRRSVLSKLLNFSAVKRRCSE